VTHDSFRFGTWLIHTASLSLSRCVGTYMCDMTHSCVWHDSFIYMTWLIHMCDVTNSHVWSDAFIRVIWLIHVWHTNTSYAWHDPFIRVIWLIHMCDTTNSYVWHASFMCVIWLIHMRDMAHMCDMSHSMCDVNLTVRRYLSVRHDSFIRMTCLIHRIWLMTHSYVWHDSFNMCVTYDAFICVQFFLRCIGMRWLRLVGSLKL